MDLQTKRTKTHLSVTVAVGRDRKIRMAWRTNQIAEFVAVSFWKKKQDELFEQLCDELCEETISHIHYNDE